MCATQKQLYHVKISTNFQIAEELGTVLESQISDFSLLEVK